MNENVQEAWLEVCDCVWIHPPYYPDGGVPRAGIRREEDGIPSAEAILEWFAENEYFCESVRTDAKARLESLKKNPAPQPEAQPVSTTSRAELGFSFSFDEQVPFGNDLRWCVSVTNTTETTGTVAVAFCVDWLQYNGQSLASVAKLVVTNALAPQSFTNIECLVPVSTYRSFLTVSETFECSAVAWNVDNEDNEDIELLRSFVRADNEPLILITPTPIPAPGETASVIVEWTNSTPFTIHADFAVALASGLRTTDGRWLCEWATRIIPPGLVCSLQTNVVVGETDALSATVYMTSDSYPPVEKTLVLDE